MGRNILIGVVSLALLGLFPATFALADTPTRDDRAALKAGLAQSDAGGRTERDTRTRSGFALLTLPMAIPGDIDTNRDGRISFEELAQHDLPNDF